MNNHPWSCPRCHETLTPSPDSLHCIQCQSAFPIIDHIPDLRIAEGPFISNARDREKAQFLASQQSLGFDELVTEYYAITPEVPREDAKRFRAGIAAARRRAAMWLAGWDVDEPQKHSTRTLVDIGCGTGPMLHAAAAGYESRIGIDIALRWLVIAARGLREMGIPAHLACAGADALPLSTRGASRVTFVSSLEHMTNQTAALGEAHRILTPAGAINVVTPNRWSIGPDPHLGIWGGSWLPPSIVDRVAHARRALPPVRQLLSARQLRSLLAQAGYQDIRVGSPFLARALEGTVPRGTASLLRGYDRLREVPVLKRFLDQIGPLIEARARP